MAQVTGAPTPQWLIEDRFSDPQHCLAIADTIIRAGEGRDEPFSKLRGCRARNSYPERPARMAFGPVARMRMAYSAAGLDGTAAPAAARRRPRCTLPSTPLLPPWRTTTPQRCPVVVTAAPRHSKLVSVRRPSGKKWKKASLDVPTNVNLGSPADVGFDARLTNAINACYGPGKLGKLIEDYGRVMTAYQLGSALALLAGFTAGRVQREALGGKRIVQGPADGTMQGEDSSSFTARQRKARVLVEDCRKYARQCCELMLTRLASATPLDCARAVYSLVRLQLHDRVLLAAVAQHTSGALAGAGPEALSGLAVGLALGGHRPTDEWLREWCVESFSSLGTFNAQELANAAFALATWRAAPSNVWLARWAQVLRQRWGTRGACPPPTLVRAAYALAAMPPAQPVPITLLLAQRGTAALGNSAADGTANTNTSSSTSSTQLQPTQPQASAPLPALPPQAPSAAPVVERIPSFAWMCGFLGAARGAVDALSPGELATLLWALARLGHVPDLVFMDAWYRAAAARMGTFRPTEAALALHALGTLRPGVGVPGALPGRFVQELLPATRSMLGNCSGVQLSQMLWGLAELRLWPGQAWMDDWLAAAEPLLRDLDGPALADAAWGLARLRARGISSAWLIALVDAVDRLLVAGGTTSGADGRNTAQSAQQQQQQSGKEPAGVAFEIGGSALAERAAAQARGFAAEGFVGDGLETEASKGGRQIDARCLAVLIWSLARLGHRPPRNWLLAFKASSETELGEEAARQLARFIAGALLQGQRQGGSSDSDGGTEGRSPSQERGRGRGRGRGKASAAAIPMAPQRTM